MAKSNADKSHTPLDKLDELYVNEDNRSDTAINPESKVMSYGEKIARATKAAAKTYEEMKRKVLIPTRRKGRG